MPPSVRNAGARDAGLQRIGFALSVTGQNLLHQRHAEFGAPGAEQLIKRGVHTNAMWGF